VLVIYELMSMEQETGEYRGTRRRTYPDATLSTTNPKCIFVFLLTVWNTKSADKI